MAFATGFEGFVALLGWSRRDREAGMLPAEDPGWFQWGYCTERGKEMSWYILVRLPSYLMRAPFSQLGDRAEPTWHQRCLLFREKLPAGDGGWEMIELECEPGIGLRR